MRLLRVHMFIILLCAIHPMMLRGQASDSIAIAYTARVDSFFQYKAPFGAFRINKPQIDLLNYNSAAYLLRSIPGVTLHELGNFGQPIFLSMQGSGQNSSGLSRGLESLNDLLTDIPDYHHVATEAIDSIVVPPSHQAFYYGGNGKSFAADVTEKRFDSPRPYSRLRHVEAPYDYLFTDAIFTVNTSEQSNLAMGITRQSLGTSNTSSTSLDTRLPNAGYEAWNLRGDYRMQFSDAYVLTIKDHYDHFIRMHNGGLLLDGSSLFKEDSAFGLSPVLFNTTMQSEVVRNRIEAEFALPLLHDSLALSRFNLSYTSNVFLFLDRLDRSSDALPRLNSKTIWDAVDLSYEDQLSTKFFDLSFGGLVRRYQVRNTPFIPARSGINLMGRGKLLLHFDPIELEGLLRYENSFGRTTLGIGASASVSLMDALEMWSGLSISARAPSLFESEWGSPRFPRFDSESKAEKIFIAEAGARWQHRNISIDARGFFRRTDNALRLFISQSNLTEDGRFLSILDETYSSGSAIENLGASVQFTLSYWRIHLTSNVALDGEMLSGQSGIQNTRLYGNGELFFRDELIANVFDLRAGIRCDFSTAYNPPTFNPEIQRYGSVWQVTNAAEVQGRYFSRHATLSPFLFAKIKTATIHLIWENVLDERYVTTMFYPMPGRGIRFGVTWAFLD